MLRPFVVSLALALLVSAARPAHADVAPPADYKDPCLAVELDASCQRCTAPEFKDKDCHSKAQAAGLSLRCRGWNYAMYCAGGAPSASATGTSSAAPRAPASGGGCSLGVMPASEGTAAMFALGLLALAIGRRTRSHRAAAAHTSA